MAYRLPCGLGRSVFARSSCSSQQLGRFHVIRQFHKTLRLGTVDLRYTTPTLKKILVRMRFFKKVEYVPDFVSASLVSLAMDYFRVKTSLLVINVLFMIYFGLYTTVRREQTIAWKERITKKYNEHRSSDK